MKPGASLGGRVLGFIGMVNDWRALFCETLTTVFRNPSNESSLSQCQRH
jgi:hypothetical protein